MTSFNDHPAQQPPPRSRHRSLFFPVMLIAVGGYALAQRYGWVTLGLGDLVANVWPLLLIGAGLNMIFGRLSPAIGAFLALLLIGSITTFQLSGLGFAARPVQLQPFSAPLAGVKAASLEFDGSASNIKLGALPANADLLIDGSFESDRATLEQSIKIDDSAARIKLDSQGQGWLNLGRGTSDWTIQLARKIPLDLDVDLSAVSAELDLRQIDVLKARINFSAGDGTLFMPSASALDKTATIEIDANAASLTIVIPPDTEARITTTSSASSVDVPSRFKANGNVFTSSGWDQAEGRLDIIIDVSAASITIE
jgi:hypothetical protein